MKKIRAGLLLVLGLTACVKPQIAFNPRADFGLINRVAVASFDGPSGTVAADLFAMDLLGRGADVVERQRLETVLREQRLAREDVLDPATIKRMGKILGVDAIFVGTVASSIPSQTYLVMTGEKSIENPVTALGGRSLSTGMAPFGVPDSQVVTSAAQASLIVRMVDVETGSILWSGRMSYEALDIQEALAGITGSLARSLVPLWPALTK